MTFNLKCILLFSDGSASEVEEASEESSKVKTLTELYNYTATFILFLFFPQATDLTQTDSSHHFVTEIITQEQ